MAVRGIDVSSYQPSTYSTRGLDFVFVKATEGTTYTNPRMRAQAAHARRNGLVVGFYHFLRPGSMAAQARYFVQRASSVPGDPLWADWEDPRVSCDDKDRFLAEVRRLRGDTHRVGLYCNTAFWTGRDNCSTAGDALWIAHYGVGPGNPGIRAAWLFHQYTDRPLDTNTARFADRAALRAWASGTHHQEDDEMNLDDAVKLGAWIPKTFPKQQGLQDGEISVRTALGSGYAYAHIAADNSKRILAKLDAQGAAITELAKALAARDTAVDVDELVDRIEAAIESITVRLDVPNRDDT
ncbi:glycoside hydrolase family 25 protein [Streptomyces boncukensis]|uniref:Lysozyme n=1 Tax=Streptomyces boncukensis TaxID=2711219 RepID=A0A6G4WSL1_9ACTN|nr:glycoside hydrolase family 25 protein [Streptomyces boncukensis]NGO67630.1 hypothetical protein [Streptomyces boncukensis]